MADKIIVPTLGESLTEATVAKWLKKVGDPVQMDEAIVELETRPARVDNKPKPVRAAPAPSVLIISRRVIKFLGLISQV